MKTGSRFLSVARSKSCNERLPAIPAIKRGAVVHVQGVAKGARWVRGGCIGSARKSVHERRSNKITPTGAEAMTSRRQRVLARVLALLDLTPSRAYPANSRRETPRGSRGAPSTNYRPRRYVLSRPCGTADAAMIMGVSGFLVVRGMSRDTYADLLSPHLGPNDVVTPLLKVSNRESNVPL